MTSPDQHWSVAGLTAPAEIAIDVWGIPHITAGSRADLFFVQGFNAARDRLWQLDLWRKRGLGLLAADHGPGFLAQDRAARLFLYRGDMDAEWAAYGPQDTRAIVESFVSGINAFIALIRADKAPRPPEFAALGIEPGLWQAEDVVRIRSHALIRNLLSEVARSQVTAKAGGETDLVRRGLFPPGWQPQSLTDEPIPAAVLTVFKLATEPVVFTTERLGAGMDANAAWLVVPGQARPDTDPGLQGSNNWVVSGARTESGRPILANDPHREHALPCLRYVVHLKCPGLDIVGAGEPVIPGISIGHNGTAAFGLTILPADQEDLYVYELHPTDDTLYRLGDHWETLGLVHEKVPVKGYSDQAVDLSYTQHGPVLLLDRTKRRVYALRTVWTEPGTAAYLSSLAYLDSRSVAQHAAALRHWGVPTLNHVYADISGTIAWLPAGMIPRRRSWDGLLPVPGNGQHEWDGFLQPEELPSLVNPSAGFIATANEMNLPAGFPLEERRVSFEWAESSRADRIKSVLAAQDSQSVAQSMALQCDVHSEPARRAVALLSGASAAERLLRDWDLALTVDSAAAALFETWWSRHLKPAMLDILGGTADVTALLAPGDNTTVLEMLEDRAPALGDRDALLGRTLAAAFAECEHMMGPFPGDWAWGLLHHGFFAHPLSHLPGAAACRDIGPLPVGGSESSPMHTGYRTSDFRATKGASLRMVFDVGNWDDSRVINGPGQSGDPASPHYDDHAALWASGGYVPLLYSRAAIDQSLRCRISLTPAEQTC